MSGGFVIGLGVRCAVVCGALLTGPMMAWGQAAPSAQPAGVQGAVAAGVKAPAGGAVVEAKPALWRVQGAHTTVYLFGTVHVMKPEVHWQTPAVTEALGKSGVLELEIANGSDMAAAQPLVMKYGMDMEHPLSEKISKEDVGKLDEAVKQAGMPGEQALEPMQPWLVYLTLSVLPMMKSGFSPTSGVDVVLQGDATKAGKKVEGLETLEQQLHFLADMPQAEQVRLLHEELEEVGKTDSAKEMSEMVDDWAKGDVEGIAKKEDGELRAKEPDLYKKLVLDRNARWADTLGGMLAGPVDQTVFVAVGAAHLAGAESVQKKLEGKGFKVVRLE